MKNSDLIGKKFGEWTILAEISNCKFLCKCSCGTEREVLRRSLFCGNSKYCGKRLKHKKEKINKIDTNFVVKSKKIRKKMDISYKKRNRKKVIETNKGKIIGNFKILKFKGIDKRYNFLWEIQCLLCSKIRIMSTGDIHRQKSCGCLRIKPKGESGFNLVYSDYKRNAKKEELNFY